MTPSLTKKNELKVKDIFLKKKKKKNMDDNSPHNVLKYNSGLEESKQCLGGFAGVSGAPSPLPRPFRFSLMGRDTHTHTHTQGAHTHHPYNINKIRL